MIQKQFKTITISLNIPVKYKWIAKQPWGAITAFLKKPTIFKDDGEEYWNLQKSELELTPMEFSPPDMNADWKKSLRRIY